MDRKSIGIEKFKNAEKLFNNIVIGETSFFLATMDFNNLNKRVEMRISQWVRNEHLFDHFLSGIIASLQLMAKEHGRELRIDNIPKEDGQFTVPHTDNTEATGLV